MVPLLPKWKDPRLLAVVMDCLHMLAFGDSEAKLAIWNCKGPKELVDVFNRATDEKLLWTASRLLKGTVIPAHSPCCKCSSTRSVHYAFSVVDLSA